MTWLSNGLIWPQYTGIPGPDDQTKVGERFFLPPQLSFGLGAMEFSYNLELLGEILTVSYPRSAHQALDYKNNQQTNCSRNRAVTLGKQGSGVSAPATQAAAGFPYSATQTRLCDCEAENPPRY
jgi:hypothetical protein